MPNASLTTFRSISRCVLETCNNRMSWYWLHVNTAIDHFMKSEKLTYISVLPKYDCFTMSCRKTLKLCHFHHVFHIERWIYRNIITKGIGSLPDNLEYCMADREIYCISISSRCIDQSTDWVIERMCNERMMNNFINESSNWSINLSKQIKL